MLRCIPYPILVTGMNEKCLFLVSNKELEKRGLKTTFNMNFINKNRRYCKNE